MPFKLTPSEKGYVAFVSWNGGITTSSISPNTENLPLIEIDACFARQLGMIHGHIVYLEPVMGLLLDQAVPQSITVEPKSEDDWEIIVT